MPAPFVVRDSNGDDVLVPSFSVFIARWFPMNDELGQVDCVTPYGVTAESTAVAVMNERAAYNELDWVEIEEWRLDMGVGERIRTIWFTRERPERNCLDLKRTEAFHSTDVARGAKGAAGSTDNAAAESVAGAQRG